MSKQPGVYPPIPSTSINAQPVFDNMHRSHALESANFLQAALKDKGRVLIHCSQGVSRSTTLLIAFLMWRSDQAYDEVFQQVKAARGVANPNIGFICQASEARAYSP